ncbi:hypothetical protein Lal_00008045 [Lupinus albus]|nr:hypothetical protein Lal_00008045 [Lupinus albus]
MVFHVKRRDPKYSKPGATSRPGETTLAQAKQLSLRRANSRSSEPGDPVFHSPRVSHRYQSWKSRLSEKEFPRRVISWAIQEDSRLSESCLAWARNEKREKRAFQEQRALGLILELEKSVDMRNDVPVGFNPGNGLAYQSWKSRLSERFSPERERIPWVGEILGYTGGFLSERELSHLDESCQFYRQYVDFATLVNKCRMYEDDLKVDELATPETISPRNYGPQRNHMRERGKGRVEDDRKPYAVTTRHCHRSFQRSSPPTVPTDEVSTSMCIKCGRLHYGSTCPGKGNGCFHSKEHAHIKRFCPKLDRRLNVIHAEETRNHGRRVALSGAWTSGVDDPTRVVSTPPSVPVVGDEIVSQCTVGVNGKTFTIVLICQMMSHISPGSLAWARDSRLSEKGFPGRVKSWAILEDSRLGEKWYFGAVNTVRFSLERESLA